MKTETLQVTTSVCPECLEQIPAYLIRRGDTVNLEKRCPDHHTSSTVVWYGTPSFQDWVRPKTPYSGSTRQPVTKGCPYDCGLCENHKQRTCTALVEITSRCNLHCPVCFADSGTVGDDPDIDLIKEMFKSIHQRTGGCNLQLSGGEPTVRADLIEIVEAARTAGFTFIQLNTNGLNLAENRDYAKELQRAGLSSVFLQFDGVNDEVYKKVRGRPLFEIKKRAIDNISQANIGIVLVPTLVPGLNTKDLWPIVQFGLDRQPHVRGVHFQPVSYFGRFPDHFQPEHFTLPEVMHNVARQSNGKITENDFTPPGCEHELCSFSARYLVQDDGTLSLLGTGSCDCTPQPAEQGALRAIDVTARQWGQLPQETKNITPQDDLSRFLQRARTHIFSISGMAFQDCWNLDLNRLRGCCIHVAQPDGRLIPFCSFNLTSRGGRSLHRHLHLQNTK